MISPSGIEYVYVRPDYTNTFGWYEVGSSWGYTTSPSLLPHFYRKAP